MVDHFDLVGSKQVEAKEALHLHFEERNVLPDEHASKKAKRQKKARHPIVLENGDTIRGLLARSKYVLYKKQKDLTLNQKQRVDLLFEYCPDIHETYQLS